MSTIRQVAGFRASVGLPADPASDQIWERRIAAGTHTIGQAYAAINTKAANTHFNRNNPPGTPQTGRTSMQQNAARVAQGFITGDPNAGTSAANRSGRGTTGERGEDSGFDYLRAARALFGYLPEALIRAYARAWEDTGNAEVALSEMRQHSSYKTHFPGNVRGDGTVRLDEQTYFAENEAFRLELTSYGIPAAQLSHLYPSLVEHGVRPDEFRRRMAGIYTNVISNISQVREYYAANFGTGSLHIQSFMASALDPTINPIQIERDIRMAQIGGEGLRAGFAIDMDHVTRMEEFGVEQGAAREFFTQAQSLLPTLASLMDRHNDPNDEFDIELLSDALVFGDPSRREDISRLFSAEESLYNPLNLFQIGQGGVVSGVRQR
jgi:hypothetical protein